MPTTSTGFRRTWFTHWQQWRRRRRADRAQAIGLRDEWAHWRAGRQGWRKR